MRLHVAVASVTSVAVVALGTGTASACEPNGFEIGGNGGDTTTLPIQPGQVVPYSFHGVATDATYVISVGGMPAEHTETSNNGWNGHKGTFVVPKVPAARGSLNVTLDVQDIDGESNPPQSPIVDYSEPKPADPAAQADPQPVEVPATSPLQPMPTSDGQPHQPPSSSPTGAPPAANGGGPTEISRGSRPDSPRTAEHQAVRHAAPVGAAHAKPVADSSNREVRTVGATAHQPKRPSPVHRSPAEPTIAPRPDRTDSPSASRRVPRTIAVASEDAIGTDLAAVLFVLVLAAGVAVFWRSRRRPAGAIQVAVAPTPPEPPTVVAVAVPVLEPPQLPDPRDLAIEAELQEMLAEHTARQEFEYSRDGPLAGVS